MPKHLLILGVSFVGVLSAQTNSFAGWHRFGESRPVDTPPVLNEFSLSAASWITIRVNEPLSSDHNRVGDAFTATLVQPLVANGIVIARRGQTVAGRVGARRELRAWGSRSTKSASPMASKYR